MLLITFCVAVSCNTRRMVETAAHLTDHAFPRLPIRQWVLSIPKRLRYFMQRDGTVLGMVLRIFLRVIAQSLSAHCPGAAQVDKAARHIGAVAFIHRFGSSLNEHVHFHVCVVDGVFEVEQGEADAAATAPGVIYGAPKLRFHQVSGIDETAVAQVQADLRRRILRAFVGRGLLESCEAKEMLAYQHSGFSVDAGVCIEAHDRTALERLLRYCARPPFAMDRLRKEGAALVYRRLIAFITEGTQIRKILDHIGVESEPPRIAPARGLPLWDDCDVQVGEGVEVEPDWDLAAQPAPDYEVDQRVNW